MKRLGDRFDPGSNGITGLRLALALTVVVSHSFKLGGYGPDPGETLTGGRTELGPVAVTAFFVLSGFLLARSRERSTLPRFLVNRFLRIFPAFWVCLVVTAVIVAPIGSILGRTTYDGGAAIGYVVGNAALLELRPFIGDLFATDPKPYIVNGSLWTLAAEFSCYLGLAVIPARWFRQTASGLFIALLVMHAIRIVELGPADVPALDLPLAFAFGTVAYLYRDRVPMGAPGALVAGAWLTFASVAGEFQLLATPAVAYLILWAAVVLPFRPRHDISYGVYIYAFPLAQLLALVGAYRLGFLPFTGLSIGLAVVAGWLSWRLLERPVLNLRRDRRASAPADALGSRAGSVDRLPQGERAALIG